MKRLGLKLFFAASTVAFVTFLNVAPADAHSCSSLCNQIRRACNSEAKATGKVAMAVCEEDRDACRVACDADPNSCVVDCQTDHGACVAACLGNPDCVSACDAALAECPGDCLGCCNYFRSSCRDDGKAARQAARLLCEDTRQTCGGTCVDPIDGACVRDCKAVEHSCRRDAKKNYWEPCKRDCAKGTERRACMSGCRKQMNQELELCSNREVLCLGACIAPGP